MQPFNSAQGLDTVLGRQNPDSSLLEKEGKLMILYSTRPDDSTARNIPGVTIVETSSLTVTVLPCLPYHSSPSNGPRKEHL